MRLDRDLTPSAMRQRLRRARRFEERCAYEVAYYLALILRRRFYLQYGFASLNDFARVELGMDARQVRERIRIVKATEDLPRTRQAFMKDKISFSAVREITRVATPATEADWIRVAATSSMRELERLVSSSKDGRVPKRPRLGLPRNRVTVSFDVTPEQMALIEAVCAREGQGKAREPDLGEVMLRGIKLLYENEPAKGGAEADRSKGTRPPRPELIYIQCRTCREAAVATSEGFVASTPEEIEVIAAQAKVRDASGPEVPDDGFVSTPSAPDVAPAKRDLPASAALRELVLARDGYQCTIPGCTERVDLDAHHLRWRRHGGPTSPDNLTATCRRHHGSTHVGTITLKGSVARGIEVLGPDQMTHVGHPEGFDPELEAILSEALPERTEIAPADRPELSSREAARCGLLSIDDIPPSIDIKWWRRFGSLFEWARHKRSLVLRPGLVPGEVTCSRKGRLPGAAPALSDLSGHAEAITRLRLAIDGSRATGKAPRAILLTGLAGLGKTTLAQAIAAELETAFHAVHGGTLDDPTSILGLLAELGQNQVLFIDEIHAVPRLVLEILYTAIEGSYVDILVSEGARTRGVRLALEPFTLIAATTDEGKLPQPLMTRFDYQIELEPLGKDAMTELIRGAAARKTLEIEAQASHLLVKASLGIPRRALSLIEEAEKAARSRASTRVSLTDARHALQIKGLDEGGLGRVQRRILDLLSRHGKPMGLEHLAARLGKTAQAILDLYEPDLLRTGRVLRTPFGRMVPAVRTVSSGRPHLRGDHRHKQPTRVIVDRACAGNAD